ncbi:phosphotransferase family protein [Haloferax denitrificans]|uniref:Phosphotransferase n=1 Tax=Haloferax denitrificans ATCC 35960 TaxID=662478 RepID=M0J3U7_9EURY|nr:phosphotransferase [Haloferax denitrificans]EMA03621.1 phosphotransferase [Haloferax denitrificans ATCC 35960]
MDPVATVLAREFPERRVAATARVPKGNHKRTAVATFADGGEVVVQTAGDAAALALEAALSRAVRERTSIPVPRVLASGALDGVGYVVAERADGDELHERFVSLDSVAQRRVARSFGVGLGQLHEQFSFDGYGRLVGSARDGQRADGGEAAAGGAAFESETATDREFDAAIDAASADDGDWEPWFSAYAREGIAALPPAFDGLRERLEDAVATASLPANPPARLYPWDFRPGNALVADGRVTAVLDWGQPMAAAPGLAVAKVEHLVADWYVEDGAPLRRAFRAGYESVRPLPAVPRAYRVAAVVRSAVDSAGEVTRPGYPERTGSAAVDFHRARLDALL